VTTSYPRRPGDVAGAFVRDAVVHLEREGIEVTVVSPASFRHFGIAYGDGLCLASGNHNFNTTNRDMRYDTRHGTTVRPSVERFNAFLTGHHDLTDNVEAFGELGFYHAVSEAVQPPVVNLNSLWIPASNYWNPFGPVTFADGTPNPNRLPGLTGVPVGGLPGRRRRLCSRAHGAPPAGSPGPCHRR
jgi:hypothetical protein